MARLSMSTTLGIGIGGACWGFMPDVCESVGAIGTCFCAIGRRFSSSVGSGLVGLLVTGDYAEHIWWFRPSGTTEVAWWVASGSRNATRVAG
jgi:hypothetical protein